MILKLTLSEDAQMDQPAPDQPTVTTAPAVPQAPKTPLMSRVRLFFWKLVSLVLLIALVVAVVLWKPWQAQIKATDRTISVTGTTTITAEPDEFVFYPTYSFDNADKQAALNAMTAKSDELVTKLKALGVPSNKIKTDTTNYDNLYDTSVSAKYTYQLFLTVTIDNKTLAQKVQDYLLTTAPGGSVTPAGSFSTAKQKALENQARDKAEEDARARADQSAKKLGFKVKAVKTVEDGSFDYIGCPGGLCAGSTGLQSASGGSSAAPQMNLQPGQNDLPYSVKVTYYID